MISVSKFTISPSFLFPSVVTSAVCGITDTEKSCAVTAATVRLIPSIVTEPFSTTYRSTSGGASTRIHTALSSRFFSAICPVPSTCPATICPPNLPFAGMARSRFTGLFRLHCASDDRFNVSCITSAVNVSRSKEVTVRQTPLTAMLSPICTSSSTFPAAIVSTAECAPFATSRIVPISSMIPVNIPYSSCSPPDTLRSASPIPVL